MTRQALARPPHVAAAAMRTASSARLRGPVLGNVTSGRACTCPGLPLPPTRPTGTTLARATRVSALVAHRSRASPLPCSLAIVCNSVVPVGLAPRAPTGTRPRSFSPLQVRAEKSAAGVAGRARIAARARRIPSRGVYSSSRAGQGHRCCKPSLATLDRQHLPAAPAP